MGREGSGFERGAPYRSAGRRIPPVRDVAAHNDLALRSSARFPRQPGEIRTSFSRPLRAGPTLEVQPGMTYRLITLAAAFALTTACAQAPAAPPTSAPTVSVAEPFKSEPVAELHVDVAESDADALLVASAMSYLGKTTARYDGESMVVVEHDRDELLEEAFSDPGFCALVAQVDIEPHDGVLSTSEAQLLESAVLAALGG